jgi:hypothetical protein
MRWVAGTALVLAGTGCAHLERRAIERSESAYRPTTTEIYPPKSETDPVPFVDKVPKKSKVIGLFHYSTERDRNFAMRCIEHNARKVGADAIWLRGIGEGQFPRYHHEPAHWETRPRTYVNYRHITIPASKGRPSMVVTEAVPTTFYHHLFIPSKDWAEMVHYTTVDALMLKVPQGP